MEKYLVFKLRNEKYALNLKNIREIIVYQEPARIPHSESYVLGMIKIRDDIITLMNSESILSSSDLDNHQNTEGKILVCEKADKKVGILVDDVYSVITISDSEIKPSPLVGMGIDSEKVGYVKGVLNREDGLVIVIDIEKTKLF